MKKVFLSIILSLLLVNSAARANQGEIINIEKLTINSGIQLPIGPEIKAINIKSIELTDDNYGHGRLIIKVMLINIDGTEIKKQYYKNIEAGHDYYYEMLSGPLKM